MQATVGFTGLLITVIYATDNPHAATPSLGYTFNLTDPAGNATMYASTIGYAGTHGTCTDPVTGAATCDNFAYPYGDKVVNNKGMTDTDAYAPFPNAIVMNWSTLFVLGLGNMCALDFQVSCLIEGCASCCKDSADFLFVCCSNLHDLALGRLVHSTQHAVCKKTIV